MKRSFSFILSIFTPQITRGFDLYARGARAGFTLIELIVVIAILGVLAAVLISAIDPLDKINSANDAGVVSAIAQIGRANDAHAASHNNTYVFGAAATVNAALVDLNAAGETRMTSYTAPNVSYTTGYNATRADGTTACTTAGANCFKYVVYASGLQAKKNSAKPVYVWVNGSGCFKAAGTPTVATTCP